MEIKKSYRLASAHVVSAKTWNRSKESYSEKGGHGKGKGGKGKDGGKRGHFRHF